jgi:manganese/zinc/iron transport system substrate-binding protein
MKNLIKCIMLVALLIAVSVSTANAKVLNVVTTIGQIADIATIIGGDQVEVKGLMGAGVDPHLYRASESDVRKLTKADIIFYSGLGLEAKLIFIFEKMKRNKTVIAVTDAIDHSQLLDSETYAGHPDPHVWFDVPHWTQAAYAIRDTLIKEDPVNKKLFEERTLTYVAQLQTLDDYVLSKGQELPVEQRVLVTAHDAFRYFGKRYGFEVVGLQGVSTESEAGTKDVAQLADFITKRQVKAIFVESSVPERNIKAVQEAVKSRGWDVVIGGELFSDAMGDAGTFEGTYIGMVTHNIDTIVGALK